MVFAVFSATFESIVRQIPSPSGFSFPFAPDENFCEFFDFGRIFPVATARIATCGMRMPFDVFYDATEGSQMRIRCLTILLPLLACTMLAKPVCGSLIVYVTSEETNSVSRFVDGNRETLISGLSGAADIALDLDGNLYVSDFDAGIIKQASPSGVVTTLASGLTNPVGIAADSYGNVYVAENTTGLLKKVTAAGVVSTLNSGLNNPIGMTIGPDGNIYVANRGSSNVLQVKPNGDSSIYGTVPSVLYDLAFDPYGDLFAVTVASGAGVYKVVPNGTATFVFGGGLPSGIAWDRDGKLYISAYNDGYVFKINSGGSPDIAASESFPTFLLTPDSLPPALSAVPEPGTLTLAGLGALGFIGARWRRRLVPPAR